MNKKLLIILIIILITIVLITSFILNQTKKSNIIETSTYTAVSYSVNEQDNTIIETIYYPAGVNPVKLVMIYTFNSGIISKTSMEAHYESISFAKESEKVKYDDIVLRRNGNVIVSDLPNDPSIGMSKEEIIQNIEKRHVEHVKVVTK